jgi:hypothetical protein
MLPIDFPAHSTVYSFFHRAKRLSEIVERLPAGWTLLPNTGRGTNAGLAESL